jgi:hypothetical protein
MPMSLLKRRERDSLEDQGLRRHTKARANRARGVWGYTPQERSIYQVKLTVKGGSYEGPSEANPGGRGRGGYSQGTIDLPS